MTEKNDDRVTHLTRREAMLAYQALTYALEENLVADQGERRTLAFLVERIERAVGAFEPGPGAGR